MDNSVHSDLLRAYRDADSHLQSHFAEIRTNIRLFAGYHYKNKGRYEYTRRLKGIGEKKIRATKNHTQRIVKKIASSILEACPGTGIFPNNPSELSDQKSAELFSSIWSDIKTQNSYRSLVRGIVFDFITCGETFTWTGYNPDKGLIVRYEQEIDENGEPIGEATPIFKGGVDIRRLYPFNVLTDPEAGCFEKTRHNIVRTLHVTKELKSKYANDESKLKYIDEAKSTYQVFDGLSGEYSEMKDHTQINEIYYRPCSEYPTGYYYFFTNSGILEEGELGISEETGLQYPIQFTGYDEINTSCRAYSIIKQTKPYQMEINRTASAAITESITLGYTTILSQAGSKIATQTCNLYRIKARDHRGPKRTAICGIHESAS